MEATQIQLPSDYKPYIQPISSNYFFYLLETIFKRPPTEKDLRYLSLCKCIEDYFEMITETYIGDMYIRGSNTGLGRTGECYVAARCGKQVTWKPGAGRDLIGVWERGLDLVPGKIEVKTCGPLALSRNNWSPRITGTLDYFVADVVVFVLMVKNFNPCHARLFAVPRAALLDTFNEQKADGIERPQINIAENRRFRGVGSLNRWYEYELLNHTRLKETIANHICGDFEIVTAEQLELFTTQNLPR